MKEEFTFRGQREDEEVLLFTKQNPWVMAKTGFIILGMGVVVILSLVLFGASNVTSIAIFLFLGIGALLMLYRWFIWSSNLYILTDQRIIKIDQKSMFSKVISEAELDRIQDIRTEIKGPISTVLNFGTIHIQTASSQTVMDLPAVTDPYEVQQQIVKAHKFSKNDLPGEIEITDNFDSKKELIK